MGKKSGLEFTKVGALLRAARSAVGVSRQAAAKWVRVSEGTVQNWEDAASPNALRLVLYMRELCARSDLGREFVLQILGLRPEGTPPIDEELERKLDLVRKTHGHEDRVVRAAFTMLEEALRATEVEA